MRRGLVIAGGGAKGAYSFGCMKALRDAGYRFEAVAGTSAGSLNAAICSIGDWEKGEELWATMSPASTYERSALLRGLPRPLAQAAGAAGVLTGVLAARAKGTPMGEHERPVRWMLFAALFGAAFLATVPFVGWNFPNALLVPLAPTMLIWPVLSSDVSKDGSRNLKQLLFFISAIASILILAATMESLPSRWLALAAILPLAVGLYFLSVLILRPISRVTVLDSGPLRHTVDRYVASGAMGIPTYATVARPIDLFDPDRPSWVPKSLAQPVVADRFGPWDPYPTSIWVPSYLRIDRMPAGKKVDCLLASAALPFGVVLPVILDDVEYVDGGVADNIPILPLLTHELDEIIVLELAPDTGMDGGISGHRRRCATLRRLLSLVDRPLPPRAVRQPDRTVNDPPRIVPLPEFERWPKITVFRPSVSLGGIFDGLLNFTPQYARQLIAQGYADTREALSKT